ncbi:hypothetical protein Pla175_12630 [Pirellulimonas nuda]|uniref:Uncharacterized protein n=1 Tax=Pirellulimonas nuda TaxID=2528009 RepID=A0A518D8U4_9BACT|nr:hypothetical protein [Pirellulimonas nuda]QDU87896.1 hypothetical protein Pla175_12630 [Pirellulimonas nuda]
MKPETTTAATTLPDQAPPAPTFAPVALAMGVAMTFWGLMAVSLNIGALWFMSIGGAALSAWALRRWIGEIVLAWEGRP